MPTIGDLRVWDGVAWSRDVDPETVGMPPLKWDPPEDQTWDELLEVLLCPLCDFELGAEACSPDHAFLADNPMQHRLLKPLLALYLKRIRAEGKQCAVCQAPLATGDCSHADVRHDQVIVAYKQWIALVECVGAVDGLRDRVGDVVENRAAWAENAVRKVAESPPWNGKLHESFLDDLRAEFRKTA